MYHGYLESPAFFWSIVCASSHTNATWILLASLPGAVNQILAVQIHAIDTHLQPINHAAISFKILSNPLLCFSRGPQPPIVARQMHLLFNFIIHPCVDSTGNLSRCYSTQTPLYYKSQESLSAKDFVSWLYYHTSFCYNKQLSLPNSLSSLHWNWIVMLRHRVYMYVLRLDTKMLYQLPSFVFGGRGVINK